VPEWIAIAVSTDFINVNLGKWLNSEDEIRRPAAGLHFGARLVQKPCQRSFEILPESWFDRIDNRRAFWGALVTDVWLNKPDHRQALFMQNGHSHRLSALFINHGSPSPYERSTAKMALGQCLYPNRLIYPKKTMLNDLDSWLKRIVHRGERAVARAMGRLPQDWLTTETSFIADRLVERLPALSERVYPHVFRWFQPTTRQLSTLLPADAGDGSASRLPL